MVGTAQPGVAAGEPAPPKQPAAGGLAATSALSPTDAWSVGGYVSDTGTVASLAEHWDGKRWRQVTTPNPAGSTYTYLQSVSALSANDVWAVGSYNDPDGTIFTLVEHWDGTTWTTVTSPNPDGSVQANLLGVMAVSPNNVWVVGSDLGSSGYTATLVEHWDGQAWTITEHPDPGSTFSELAGVTATSAKDVWVVGYDFSQTIKGYQTLVEHWNGHAWKAVSSPNALLYSFLQSVSEVSPTDVWAVGYTNDSSGYQTLVEHWDGSSWTRVKSPNPSKDYVILNGVSAASARSVWSVGCYQSADGDSKTLVERWNGTGWKRVRSPNPPSSPTNCLQAVSTDSVRDAWATGYKLGTENLTPLLEHWNGSSWKLA